MLHSAILKSLANLTHRSIILPPDLFVSPYENIVNEKNKLTQPIPILFSHLMTIIFILKYPL